MKLNVNFFIAIAAFLMIIGCNQKSIDFETVEGIEFKMMEVSSNFFKDDAPKELNLMFSYEKEDTSATDEEDVFAHFDNNLSDVLDSSDIEFMIETIDTIQHQMKDIEELDFFNEIKGMSSFSNIRNFSGGAYTNGFGIHYAVKILDTIDYNVNVDYALQFKTVFKNKEPEHRVPLKNGETSLKAIRQNLVKALEAVKKYEPTKE